MGPLKTAHQSSLTAFCGLCSALMLMRVKQKSTNTKVYILSVFRELLTNTRSQASIHYWAAGPVISIQVAASAGNSWRYARAGRKWLLRLLTNRHCLLKSDSQVETKRHVMSRQRCRSILGKQCTCMAPMLIRFFQPGSVVMQNSRNRAFCCLSANVVAPTFGP